MAPPSTEDRNPRTTHLDCLPSSAIVRIMNAEDRVVVDAVLAEADKIARAIDTIAARLEEGGRLFYVGAGTSGRLGVLDASECPPTFGVSPDMVVGIIAGGRDALDHAIEGAEDRADQGALDLAAHAVGPSDVVVGISASGRTPYVVGALGHAEAVGASTIGIACVGDAPIASLVGISIAPAVGPEVIAGSTRLKAGTATKLVLNMLSTGSMVRLGHTHGNLMVDVRPTNTKLVARARAIVSELTGLSLERSAAALERAGDIKTAVVGAKLDLPPEDARALLARTGGRLRAALARGNAWTAAAEHLIVGVDGGATKTAAWLARASGEVIGRGTSGPGNPRSVGFAEAQRSIDVALAGAFADAGLPRGPVAAAALALAGVGRQDEREEIAQWAERVGLARAVVVTDDAESVLAAGAPEGWGVALISGTGTLAIGRSEQGETSRAGGWGYLLGDEGGAYAIALAGLRAAMRSADGLEPPTSLVSALTGRLGVDQPRDFVARVYGPAMTREQIASLAALVFAEASTDPTARRIIGEAASSLAELVGRVATRLGFGDRAYPLALAGSVLVHQPAFRALLLGKLTAAGRAPAVARVIPEPAAGAVAIAQRSRLTDD